MLKTWKYIQKATAKFFPH